MNCPNLKNKKILKKSLLVLLGIIIISFIHSPILYRSEAKNTTTYTANKFIYYSINQNHQSTKSISAKQTNWLERSFEQYSIVWLIISSAIGGVIGASVKLAFEVVLPARLKERREVIVLTHKYTTPILLAAEALRNRLSNMIKLIDLAE